MTRKFDVLVIGRGLAGFAAALSLSAKKKRIGILFNGTGATSVSSGAWDFGPIVDSHSSYNSLRESVLWKKLFEDVLIEDYSIPQFSQVEPVISSLELALKDSLSISSNLQIPSCLPSSSGRWRLAFIAQKLQFSSQLSTLAKKKVAVIGSPAWRIRTDLLAKKWREEAEQWNFKLHLEPVKLPSDSRELDSPVAHIATRIRHSPQYRNRLLEQIKTVQQVGKFDFLLFPPIFAEEEIAKAWEKELGVELGECLCSTEPTAGLRLAHAIQSACNRMDITGIPVRDLKYHVRSRRITSLTAQLTEEGEWVDLEASSFVLATGKFFGGGISFGFDQVSESVLNLPLFCDRSKEVKYRSELPWGTNVEFESPQPWAKVGTWLDSRMRPIDAAKVPVFDNLTCGGSLIGGIDFLRANIGNGFMALSGWRSGELAS